MTKKIAMRQDDKIDKVSKAIFHYLTHNFSPEERLKIANQLKEMAQETLLVAEVTTAIELTEEEKKTVEEMIHKKFGPKVTTTFLINKEIIGGIRIKIGDMLIDRSFQKMLDKIEEKIVG